MKMLELECQSDETSVSRMPLVVISYWQTLVKFLRFFSFQFALTSQCQGLPKGPWVRALLNFSGQKSLNSVVKDAYGSTNLKAYLQD